MVQTIFTKQLNNSLSIARSVRYRVPSFDEVNNHITGCMVESSLNNLRYYEQNNKPTIQTAETVVNELSGKKKTLLHGK